MTVENSPIEEEEGYDGGEVSGRDVGRDVKDLEDEDAAGGRDDVVALKHNNLLF